MSNGPTPPGAPYTNREMIRDIFFYLQVLVTGVVAAIVGANRNTAERIQEVQQSQVQQQDTSTEVKRKLEAKLEEDDKQIGIQLYSTWKYLEDVAEVSGKWADSLKAAEAKKVYENHVRRRNGN